jgi:glyoxylase-like metal-dependent hydrolase (beta-lactamase superfamily II)
MKRLLKSAVVVVILLVVAVGGLVAYTFMGRRAIMDGQEINGVRVVEDGITSLAVVTIDGRQVVLVDAGNDANGQAILTELTRRGLGPEAVSTILLTHGHQDHIAAVHLFPNAQVMALEAEVPLVEGRVGARGPVTRLFPVRPTGITVSRQLQNGDVVTVGNTTFRVYAVPGHTVGSAAYLVNGVLLIGDSADVTSAGALQGSPWIFSDSQSDNRASLRRLEQQLVADGADVRAIVPAHSGAIEGIGALTALVRATPQ